MSPLKSNRLFAGNQNILGVKYLSIGRFLNSKGQEMSRYSVAYKKGESWTNKGFYFGSNTSQYDAFKLALSFLISQGLTTQSYEELLETYLTHNHHKL